MSGGHFEYDQHKIYEIAKSIQSILDKQGKEIPKENQWMTQEWYDEHPEEQLYPTYSKETQEEFERAIEFLKKGYIYAHRIDWFLSGDDGEETFHERLKEELNKNEL